MNPCPDISTLDDLNFDEREAHLAQCPSCHMLFALRDGGEESFSPDCENTEMLLAVASDCELSPLDQRRLTRHLESCARCTSLASDMLLSDGEQAVPKAPRVNTWEPVSAYQAPAQPANDQRSLVFFGLGLLTAAAAIFLILWGTGESKENKTQGFVADVDPSRDSSSHDRAPANPSKANPDTETPASTVGASRPAPVMQAPPPLTLEEHLSKAAEATKGTDYALAMSHCRAALKIEPENQRAHTLCAVAACNMNDPVSSRFHISAVTSNPRAQGLTQVCKRLNVDLDGPVPTLATDVEGNAKPQYPDLAAQGKTRTTPAIRPMPAPSMISQISHRALLQTAQRSLGMGEHEKAFKTASAALALIPSDQASAFTAGAAACHLKKKASAAVFYSKLTSPSQSKKLARYCDAEGVSDLSGESTDRSTGTRELVQKAEALVRETHYQKGLKAAEAALEQESENQRALTTAAVASCNLKLSKKSRDYIARVKSSQRRQGLKQICMRLGMKQSSDEDKAASSSLREEPSVEELVLASEQAVRNTQYGKAGKLCRAAMEREPGNQRAITTCVIAACNLKKGNAAKKYMRRVKSSQRRMGLRQICLRSGVPGFSQ